MKKINSRTEDGSRINGTLEGETFKGSIWIKGGARVGSTPGIYSAELSAPIALVVRIATNQSVYWEHYGINFLE